MLVFAQPRRPVEWHARSGGALDAADQFAVRRSPRHDSQTLAARKELGGFGIVSVPDCQTRSLIAPWLAKG